MDIIDSLKWRSSIKKFDKNAILSNSTIEKICEILLLTPSAYWLQPWKFVFVDNTDVRMKLKEVSWNQPQITESSVLLILCTVNDIDENFVNGYIEDVSNIRSIPIENLDWYKKMMIQNIVSLPNDQKYAWAREQVNIVLWSLIASLAVEKIDMCPVAWFDKDKYDEILDLKKDWISACIVCPIWFRSVEDDYSKMPKVRYTKNKLIINK